MSVQQMAMVWKYQLPFNHAWVLMALADHADDDGANCYPAVPYIGWKTGYSERQVRRILKRLRDVGVLIPLDDGQGPGRPVHYQLNLTALTAKDAYQPPRRYLSPRLRLIVIERDQQTCRYCGQRGSITTAPDGQPWQIDRIIPGSKGGNYTEENVVLACGPCNRRRGDKMAPLSATDQMRDAGAPGGDSVGAHGGDIQKSPKPSVTIIEPSEEPSVHTREGPPGESVDYAWVVTLREIDEWAAKGEPHMEPLVAWTIEKGYTRGHLEAAAIGLAATSGKTLKGYRNLAAAFQRRLNEGYDRIPTDGRQPEGDQRRAPSGRAAGWDNNPDQA